MSKNEAGRKMLMDFCELCGINDRVLANDLINDSAGMAIEIDAEVGEVTTQNAILVTMLGVCLYTLGMDRVVTDWGWKAADDEMPIASTKTTNQLLKYVLKNYPKKVKEDYEKAKFHAGN